MLAAIAVGDVREYHVSFARQLDLRDAREAAAHLVPVRALRRAELVPPHFLEEGEVGIGLFALARIARVVHGVRSGGPRNAAAGGRVLDASDPIRQLASGRHLEDVERSVLAAVLRQRYGDQLPVRRRLVEVDGHAALRLAQVGIDDHALRATIIRPGQDPRSLEEHLENLHWAAEEVMPAFR